MKTQDISAKKKIEHLEKRLVEQQTLINKLADKQTINCINRWRSVFENSHNQVLVIDREGIIKEINTTKENNGNTSRIIGQKVFSFITSDSVEPYKKAIERIYTLGQSESLELAGVGPVEGEVYHYYSTLSPIKNGEGKVEEISVIVQNITQRVKAEKRAQELQERYEKFSSISSEGIIVHDYGVVLEVNDAAIRMLGYSEEELRKMNMNQAFNPKDETVMRSNMRTGFETQYNNIKIRKKDGTFVTCEIRAKNVVYENKKVRVAYLRDITENIKAEEEIKQLEDRYKKLSEASFEAILLHENGNIIEVNDAFINMFGYTREELTKIPAFNLTIPEQRQKLVARVKNRIEGAEEYTGLRKNGSTFYANLNTKEIAFNGKFVRVVAISDITDRKKYEIMLARINKDYENLIKSSPDGMFVINTKGEIEFANSSALGMIGCAAVEEIKGKPMLGFFNKKYHEITKARWVRVWSGVEVPFVNKELITTNKGQLKIESKPVLFNFKGKPSILLVCHDIESQEKLAKEQVRLRVVTETNKALKNEIKQRNKIENELRDSEDKIRQSLNEKDVLLKEIHHRVKNNLQVISSILNLQSTYVKDEKTLDILKESQNRIKSMSFIHESLYRNKDFSNIHLKDYVSNLKSNLLISYSGSSKKITLQQKIDNVFLNLDVAIPLGLIINELVSNALKYAFAKKKNGKLLLCIDQTNKSNYKMMISDNGSGLPKNINFRKTESLGLQLVTILVEQLDGKIKLDNKNGAKFTISFSKKAK